jgi:hypothetical protein
MGVRQRPKRDGRNELMAMSASANATSAITTSPRMIIGVR